MNPSPYSAEVFHGRDLSQLVRYRGYVAPKCRSSSRKSKHGRKDGIVRLPLQLEKLAYQIYKRPGGFGLPAPRRALKQGIPAPCQCGHTELPHGTPSAHPAAPAHQLALRGGCSTYNPAERQIWSISGPLHSIRVSGTNALHRTMRHLRQAPRSNQGHSALPDGPSVASYLSEQHHQETTEYSASTLHELAHLLLGMNGLNQIR